MLSKIANEVSTVFNYKIRIRKPAVFIIVLIGV